MTHSVARSTSWAACSATSIRRFEGEDAFNLIEEIRRLARQFASGEPQPATS